MGGGVTIIYVKDTTATPEQATHTHTRFHGEIHSAWYWESKQRKCIRVLQVGQAVDDLIPTNISAL